MSTNQAQPPTAGPVAQQSVAIQPHLATQPLTTLKQSGRGLERKLAGKTLWEWLTVLLVPLMIAVFTIATTIQQNSISQRQHNSDQAIAADNRQKDIQIADDQQKEDTLVNYQKEISDLLLHEALGSSKEGDSVRVVARTITLTALQKLDSKRKGVLLRFLYEAKLISKNNVVIVLNGANLSQADLSWANLGGANFDGANLEAANLSYVNLSEASLRGAILDNTHLNDANLSKAVLTPLSSFSINQVNFYFTSLQNADLNKADLFGTDLTGAVLINANLEKTRLSAAKLCRTDLTRTNLTGARLGAYGVDLGGGADLTDAKVTKEQLASAKWLNDAILPDGSKYPSKSYPIPNHTEPVDG